LDEGVGEIAWEDGFLIELDNDGFPGESERGQEIGEEDFRVEGVSLAVEGH
jgi:hypothetical protein